MLESVNLCLKLKQGNLQHSGLSFGHWVSDKGGSATLVRVGLWHC